MFYPSQSARAERNKEAFRGKLSEQEEQQIVALHEQGLSSYQIAARMNRLDNTISWAMLRLGLRAPVQRVFEFTRNGRRVKSFSAEEDAAITALRVGGLTAPEIVERLSLPRRATTINNRLNALAMAEEIFQ